MKKIYNLLVIILIVYSSAIAQNDVNIPVTAKAVYFDISPPLKSLPVIKPAKNKEILFEISNKIGFFEADNATDQSAAMEDPALQHYQFDNPSWISPPKQNFEGVGNLSFVYPPDTQGDVGPDHYVQVVNSNFAIYSKSGATLLGPAALSTIWTGIPAPWAGTNSGDPVVLYDQAANRWIISQFSLPTGNYAELIAISQTSDPTGSWYRYVFNFGTQMPDYPKFGIWHDGYYMSINRFLNGSTFSGIQACSFNRTSMLAGDPNAQMISFTLGSGVISSLLPSDWDGVTPPVAGEPNYFVGRLSTNLLSMYEFHVDWVTPANSTFTLANSLTTATYDPTICGAFRGRCIPQPGTAVMLESLSDRLMYRLQYRNFGTHQSMVVNHAVDVTGSGRSGIRWYELRNTGSGWSIYQQSTFSPDANQRWMGSIAMNGKGDIALGYSVSNATDIYPSIRYTGRLANDPPGIMTLPEQNLMTGTGYQTGAAARWGDYSMMSVDPSDDTTFWYTTEYLQTTGVAPWQTRITSFAFDLHPSVITGGKDFISNAGATLHGTINPNGISASYYFEWGETNAYGFASASALAGSGTTAVNVSVPISGLNPGTMYHYRLVGVGGGATILGGDQTFTTCPSVNTASVSIVATATQVCSGEKVSFTATPVNGGTTPVYQWYVGSTPVGSGLDTYSYLPSNGDVVTVTMSTSDLCTVPFIATSNTVDITVTSASISGYARYYNNPGTLLDGLKITLKQGGSVVGSPVITGTNGFYSFGELSNGTYDLEITTAHSSGQWQTWGGVNNTDYLLVSRHASGIALLAIEPPVVRTAANVKTLNPLIDIQDANAIKLAAKYGWGSPTPYFDIPKWVFSGVNAASAISGIQVACDHQTRDIRALCAGDVNGSFIPPSGSKEAVTKLELLQVGHLSMKRELTFPVRAEADMEIGAITLFLDFDPSLIEITGVDMPNAGSEAPYFVVRENMLHIGWASLNPVNVKARETILLIRAKSVGEGPVRFTLNNNPLCELADGNGNVLEGAKLSVADAGASIPYNALGVVSVYPNPAKDFLNIEFQMETAGVFSAELLNLQGIIVGGFAQTEIPEGFHKVSMNLPGIENGAYLLKVRTNGQTNTTKVIVNK